MKKFKMLTASLNVYKGGGNYLGQVEKELVWDISNQQEMGKQDNTNGDVRYYLDVYFDLDKMEFSIYTIGYSNAYRGKTINDFINAIKKIKTPKMEEWNSTSKKTKTPRELLGMLFKRKIHRQVLEAFFEGDKDKVINIINQ